MKIKEQLPYIGTDLENGFAKIGEYIEIDIKGWVNFRPDYKAFKSNPYQSEDTCVGVLTGLSNFEDCESQLREIKQVTIEEEIKKKNYDFYKHPKAQECDEITSIKDSLFKMIKIGKKFNRFENRHLGHGNSSKAFKSNLYFNGLQFLKWAKSNNFKIPDELKFGEHENGTLYWIENEGSAGVATTENDIEEQVNRELLKICPELETFYSALKREVDLIASFGTMTEIEQDELKNIACRYFENSHNDYKILAHQYIENENIYKNVQQRRRRIIGTILQKYLKTNLSSAINYKSIGTTIDLLFKKHNNIIK